MNRKEPPRILIGVTVDQSFNFHSNLAVALKDKGWAVHLVSSGGPNMAKLADQVRTHQLQMARNPSPLRDAKSFLQWISLLRSVKPDIVLVGTPKASLLGLIASKFTKVPTRIYFIHGLRFESLAGPLRKILLGMEKIALACSTKAIAVSPSVREKVLASGLTSTDKIELLGAGSAQGLDLDVFKPNSGPREKTELQKAIGLMPNVPTIGFVGRLTAEKGIRELKDALLITKAAGLEMQVLLIGQTEDQVGEMVVETLKENGIRVVSTGRVSNPAPYYRVMDVFCLPTYREGLGNVILEAFASKIPVVSTQVTGVVDLVQHRKTGLLVPPKDANTLATAVQFILSNPDFANTIAESAYRFVIEKFDSHEVVERQLEFLIQQEEAASQT